MQPCSTPTNSFVSASQHGFFTGFPLLIPDAPASSPHGMFRLGWLTSPTPDDVALAPASSSPPKPEVAHPVRPSGAQVLASVLTATTTTLALSYLGVAGTIIGAGLASTFTVLANYWYTRSIIHTQRKVTQLTPKAVRARAESRSGSAETAPPPNAGPDAVSGSDLMSEPGGAETQTSTPPSTPPETLMSAARSGKRRFIVPIVVIFVLLLGLVTLIELGIGKPLSAAVRGEDGTGTSVFFSRTPQNSAPTPPADDAPGQAPSATPDDAPDQAPTTPPADGDPSTEPTPGPETPEPTEPEPDAPVEPVEPAEPTEPGDPEAQGPTDAPADEQAAGH